MQLEYRIKSKSRNQKLSPNCIFLTNFRFFSRVQAFLVHDCAGLAARQQRERGVKHSSRNHYFGSCVVQRGLKLCVCEELNMASKSFSLKALKSKKSSKSKPKEEEPSPENPSYQGECDEPEENESIACEEDAIYDGIW